MMEYWNIGSLGCIVLKNTMIHEKNQCKWIAKQISISQTRIWFVINHFSLISLFQYSTIPRNRHKPVKIKIAEWQRQSAAIQKDLGDTPLLSMRDGKDFIIIRQQRFQAEPAVHRLVGASRRIYLFCQRHRPIQSICSAFSDIPDNAIVTFLNMMVDKKAKERKWAHATHHWNSWQINNLCASHA